MDVFEKENYATSQRLNDVEIALRKMYREGAKSRFVDIVPGMMVLHRKLVTFNDENVATGPAIFRVIAVNALVESSLLEKMSNESSEIPDADILNPIVVYVDLDWNVYLRSLSEFRDGRFAVLPQITRLKDATPASLLAETERECQVRQIRLLKQLWEQEHKRADKFSVWLHHALDELEKIRSVLTPEPYTTEDGNVN